MKIVDYGEKQTLKFLLTKSKVLIKLIISKKIVMQKGENMAKAKKARCAAKTKEEKSCKNTVSGKSKCCAPHKRKQYIEVTSCDKLKGAWIFQVLFC